MTQDGNQIIDHARAAMAMAEARNDDDFNIYAFLSVFHPEMTHEQKRVFIGSCGNDEEERT